MAKNRTIFRPEATERFSSPEQLTDYLRVGNPGIWVILAAILLMLAGIFAWSMIGTLETKAGATAVVENNTALVACDTAYTLKEGMVLRLGGQDYKITATQKDEYGRPVGVAEVGLPDGTYDCVVITEAVHPVSFLFENR